MSNEIAQQQGRSVVDAHSAAEIRAQINRIQEVMKGVMKAETHYGTIPGTDKPTLYKAGSEILLSTFRIAVQPEVIDMSDDNEIRYRVLAHGIHMASGNTVGTGLGEASSSEEKYKWRRAVCDEEYEEAEVDRRRIKFAKARNGTIYRNKQIRAEPADVANTVLKMAKKRAQIDLTLTALAASDIFTQDVEDLPEELRGAAESPQQSEAPQASAGPEKATEAQINLIRGKLEKAGIDASDLLAAIGVQALDGMPFSKVNEALAWIKEQAK